MRAEFRARRARIGRLAVVAGVVASAAALLAYAGIVPAVAGAIALVGAGVAAGFAHARIWRCPACGGHLGRLYLGVPGPDHCPACGIRLTDR